MTQHHRSIRMAADSDLETELKELRSKYAIVSRKAELFEGGFHALVKYNQHQIDASHEKGKVCADCQTLRTDIAKYYGPLTQEGFVK